MAWTAVESKVQSLSASEPALCGDVAHLARCIGDVGEEVARMRQECSPKVEEVTFDGDELRVRFKSTALHLSDSRSPLTAACERLEQVSGH